MADSVISLKLVTDQFGYLDYDDLPVTCVYYPRMSVDTVCAAHTAEQAPRTRNAHVKYSAVPVEWEDNGYTAIQ